MPTPLVRSLPAALRLLLDVGRGSLGFAEAGGPSFEPATPDLAALARRHNMTFWVAARAAADDRLAAHRAALDADLHVQTIAALTATSQLLEALGALESIGVRAVSIKGPIYAQWLYGTIAARRFVDLDIIVEPHATPEALQCLRGLGYQLPDYSSDESARVIFAGRAAYPLGREGALDIDLHWRLADTKFTSAISPALLIDCAVHVSLAGRTVSAPEPSHAALTAFQHAAKHGWCGLEMILALAFLLRRGDVDWNEVNESAREAGGLTAVLAGVRLARDLFDVPTPAFQAANDRTIDALVARAGAALTMPSGVHADWRAERALHRAVLDRRRDRFKYDLLRLVMPTPLDARWCPLPPAAAPMYAPLRLVRLAARAFGATLEQPW